MGQHILENWILCIIPNGVYCVDIFDIFTLRTCRRWFWRQSNFHSGDQHVLTPFAVGTFVRGFTLVPISRACLVCCAGSIWDSNETSRLHGWRSFDLLLCTNWSQRT